MPLKVIDAAGSTVTTGVPTDAVFRAAATNVAIVGTQDTIIIKGSDTKTVRIRRIELGGIATAASAWAVTLIRRSADCTGGTPVTPTVAKMDTTSASATATVRHFTAANTPGAAVATLWAGRWNLGIAASAQVTPTVIEGTGRASIVLRGATDFLVVNAAGAIPTGATFDYTIEWEESAS